MGLKKKMLTGNAPNIYPPKIKKNGPKMPKKGGEIFFFEIFFLRPIPKVLGQVWGKKSKKNWKKKYRLGVIEENGFFWKKS